MIVNRHFSPCIKYALMELPMEDVPITPADCRCARLCISAVSGGGGKTLLSLGLIEVVGRKEAIGNPKLYGTTDEFLKRFRLESIDKLPDYDDLLRSIEELKNRQVESDSLYNEFEIPDEQPPEFLQGEEVEKVELPLEAAATLTPAAEEESKEPPRQ